MTNVAVTTQNDDKEGRHSELENFSIPSCVTLTQVSPPNRKPGK